MLSSPDAAHPVTKRRVFGRCTTWRADAWVLLAVVLLVGCTATSDKALNTLAAEAKLTPAPADRVALLETAVQTLRQEGYAIDRADFRQGVLTTTPRDVATALEPWHGQRQIAGDAGAGTLAHLRRVVRIDFAEPAPDASANVATPLQLRVQLERFEAPVLRVVNAAGGYAFSQLSDVPTPWAQRGIGGAYWRPIGRDLTEEQRLTQALLSRLP